MKKQSLLNNIFIVLGIITLIMVICIVPICITSRINISEGNIAKSAYNELINSDIEAKYKDNVIMVKKGYESQISKMQIMQNTIVIYYIVCVACILFAIGCYSEKTNKFIFKITLITAITIFLGIILYAILKIIA